MASCGKRKHNSKPLHDKHQALIEVENGGKKKDIAMKYGVPMNTLSTWIKNSDKTRQKFLYTKTKRPYSF